MAASVAGKFVSALSIIRGTTGRGLNLGYGQTCALQQVRNYAARKGTREKARKKKVKVVIEKVGFIPHKDRVKDNKVFTLNDVRIDDSWKRDPPKDDVYIGKYYKWKIYPLAEAIQCHKETHSPEMLDDPNVYIKAVVEMDMKGPRPSKPVTPFTRIVLPPHVFDHGETRSVLVVCKTPEMQEEARKAGATLVGGSEIISEIQKGKILVADYDHIIAHPNMMAELVVIKGLLKKKFPTSAAGSLGINITDMIARFLHGVKYNGSPHERFRLYGTCRAIFGRLNMETQQLEENFAAVIGHINSYRPKRDGEFITRICITTELAREFLKVDHTLYTEDKKDEEVEDDDDDDDDDAQESVAAAP